MNIFVDLPTWRFDSPRFDANSKKKKNQIPSGMFLRQYEYLTESWGVGVCVSVMRCMRKTCTHPGVVKTSLEGLYRNWRHHLKDCTETGIGVSGFRSDLSLVIHSTLPFRSVSASVGLRLRLIHQIQLPSVWTSWVAFKVVVTPD